MFEIVQGTEEWRQIRLGKVTASRVADVIAKTKSGPSASRANYAAQLVAERLTGVAEEGYQSAAMARGSEMEGAAREAYEFDRGVTVREVGFVPHPSIGEAGASPDGYVGDVGLVEIKCPNVATHITTLLSGKIPGAYTTQMQWQMACTGRAWCDFVSYDPRLPDAMQLFVQRIHRDDERIAELEAEVVAFLGEVRSTVAQLRAKFQPAPAPVNFLEAG